MSSVCPLPLKGSAPPGPGGAWVCRDPKHLTLQPSHGWPQMPLRHCAVLNTGPRSRECPLGWIPGCQSLCRANTESSCWVFGKAASGSLMSNLQGCFPPLMVQNSLGGQGAGWLDGAQAHDGQQLEKQKWRTPSWSWLQRQLPWEAPPLPGDHPCGCGQGGQWGGHEAGITAWIPGQVCHWPAPGL